MKVKKLFESDMCFILPRNLPVRYSNLISYWAAWTHAQICAEISKRSIFVFKTFQMLYFICLSLLMRLAIPRSFSCLYSKFEVANVKRSKFIFYHFFANLWSEWRRKLWSISSHTMTSNVTTFPSPSSLEIDWVEFFFFLSHSALLPQKSDKWTCTQQILFV